MSNELTPKPAGRPSGYTEEIADIICERMICGRDDKPESLRSICREEGMPALGTVMRWLAKHEGFREQYRAAREAQSEVHQEELLEIADNCTDDVQILLGDGETALGRIDHSAIARAKLRVDTRKWVMSKMQPKKYGEKTSHEIAGPEGGPIETKHSGSVTLDADLAGKSLDELTRMFTEKMKG